ncbi:hypothetical protein [Rhodoblastus sp.]|uniref:hypothetical protein n=1 Tax=Rhodoblastus sp. TaxID=1962975 RepID=UPI003F976EEF
MASSRAGGSTGPIGAPPVSPLRRFFAPVRLYEEFADPRRDVAVKRWGSTAVPGDTPYIFARHKAHWRRHCATSTNVLYGS